jgi:hypothetical protein
MKQKDIIFILASAVFVIVVWIILEVIHNSASSTISEKLNTQIIPINADFDVKTIDNIKKKEKVEPLYTITENIIPTITLTPNASPTPTIQLTQTGSGAGQASTGGALSQ